MCSSDLVGAVFVLLAARPENESLVPEVVGTVMMAVDHHEPVAGNPAGPDEKSARSAAS